MSNPPSPTPKKDAAEAPPNPYVLVALCAGGSSAAIAFVSLMAFPRFSGDTSALWAISTMIAVMVFSPCAMGIGIAFFMSKRSKE